MRNLSVDLRPKTLDDIIGSAQVVAAIKNMISADRIPIGMVFSGSPGTGKTTFAHLVARYVQGPNFAGEPDATVVNAADNNGIDDTRELIANSAYAPREGRYKIIILNEAQGLTAKAQEALLEPLEDKLSSTIWIVTTTEPKKILPALLDRLTKFSLKGLTDKERDALVNRVYAAANGTRDIAPLKTTLDREKITSPRAIVQAVDAYLGGLSAEESVHSSEYEPTFPDIAKEVMRGNWKRASEYLAAINKTDGTSLRIFLASWFGTVLTNENDEKRTDALSECILGLSRNQFAETPLSLAVTKAVLYQCCRRLRATSSSR